MAKIRINPEWKQKILKAIDEKTFTEHASAYTFAIQFLVVELDKRAIPFRVVKLGAGVQKITVVAGECPMCRRPMP
jgi:hypothetical protein